MHLPVIYRLVFFAVALGHFAFKVDGIYWNNNEPSDPEINLPEINPKHPDAAKSIFDFFVKDIDGNTISLDKYRGNVTIIVNIASGCCLRNKNFADLEALRSHYADFGFNILAFPTNSLVQEPRSNSGIKKFNDENGGKNFTLFSKIAVNGGTTHPLYVYLKNKFGGTFFNNVKWNYIKFLVSREGIPVRRYGPMEEIEATENDVRAELVKTSSKEVADLVKNSSKAVVADEH